MRKKRSQLLAHSALGLFAHSALGLFAHSALGLFGRIDPDVEISFIGTVGAAASAHNWVPYTTDGVYHTISPPWA